MSVVGATAAGFAPSFVPPAPAVTQTALPSPPGVSPAPAGSPSEVTNNPWEGQYYLARVRVDPTGQGDNDSLGAILLNQGLTAQEIYATDGEGRTFYQQVAEYNRLKDPNIVRGGQYLSVPSRLPPEAADGTLDVLNTQGLSPNESFPSTVGSPQANINGLVTRGPDGRAATIDTGGRDTVLSESNLVSPGGRAYITEQGYGDDEATARVVARSADDTARTYSFVDVQPDRTTVGIEDDDRTPGKMRAAFDHGHLRITNPGQRPGDDVVTDLDLGLDPRARLNMEGLDGVEVTRKNTGESDILFLGHDGRSTFWQSTQQP